MHPGKNTLLNGTLYVLALVGTCVAQLKDLHALEYACRPLLMLILSSWFFFNSRRVGDRFTLLIQAGLFFSLIGDVALMFTHVDNFNFIVGLGAFFLAQLCYAFAFIQNMAAVSALEGLLPASLITVGIGTYFFFFTWDLLPHVEEGLGLPVIAYLSALAFMGMAAAFRFRRTYHNSFWMVMAGALLLMASGSLLTLERFRLPMSWAPLWSMVGYGAAQALIAAGALTHVLDPDNLRKREALST